MAADEVLLARRREAVGRMLRRLAAGDVFTRSQVFGLEIANSKATAQSWGWRILRYLEDIGVIEGVRSTPEKNSTMLYSAKVVVDPDDIDLAEACMRAGSNWTGPGSMPAPGAPPLPSPDPDLAGDPGWEGHDPSVQEDAPPSTDAMLVALVGAIPQLTQEMGARFAQLEQRIAAWEEPLSIIQQVVTPENRLAEDERILHLVNDVGHIDTKMEEVERKLAALDQRLSDVHGRVSLVYTSVSKTATATLAPTVTVPEHLTKAITNLSTKMGAVEAKLGLVTGMFDALVKELDAAARRRRAANEASSQDIKALLDKRDEIKTPEKTR